MQCCWSVRTQHQHDGSGSMRRANFIGCVLVPLWNKFFRASFWLWPYPYLTCALRAAEAHHQIQTDCCEAPRRRTLRRALRSRRVVVVVFCLDDCVRDVAIDLHVLGLRTSRIRALLECRTWQDSSHITTHRTSYHRGISGSGNASTTAKHHTIKAGARSTVPVPERCCECKMVCCVAEV